LREGVALKTPLGSTFTIVKIKNIQQVSKSSTSIICKGNVLLDNARESQLLMEVFRDEDGDMMYRFNEVN